MYLGLARAHFLSETGQCKPFDAAADGYCRSEGCGVVVLKRLSQAIAEDDRILGVIRGIEINQCGRSKSITHPDSSTQAALFRKLLKRSGISPNMVSVVEAHGTGKLNHYPVLLSRLITNYSFLRHTSWRLRRDQQPRGRIWSRENPR